MFIKIGREEESNPGKTYVGMGGDLNWETHTPQLEYGDSSGTLRSLDEFDLLVRLLRHLACTGGYVQFTLALRASYMHFVNELLAVSTVDLDCGDPDRCAMWSAPMLLYRKCRYRCSSTTKTYLDTDSSKSWSKKSWSFSMDAMSMGNADSAKIKK